MAVADAATLASASPDSRAHETAVRSPLSAALLLCRFWTVAAVLLAAASFPHSSFFRIQDIRIVGTRLIDASDVQTLSGLHVGAPVFSVIPEEIARRISAHPRLRSAEVGITAGGRVTIRVTERPPAAVMPYRGRYVVLDPMGVAIGDRPDPGILPIITVDETELAWMRLGTAVPSSAVPESIDALAQLPPALPRTGLLLRRTAAGDLSVLTPDRIVVRLGRIRGLSDRAAMLPQILATIRARRLAVEYVDLRFSGNVILKPAADTGGAPGAGVKP